RGPLWHRHPGEALPHLESNLVARPLALGLGPEHEVEVAELGAWAFTIGGAIFEGRFSPEGGIRAQIEAVLAALGTIGPQ
ncbi:MAG: hypothetical protein QXK34_00975, partial [Candidatus Bathyarchaeia archaeon]